MIFRVSRFRGMLVVAGGLTTVAALPFAHAWPTTSPSAKSAAHLKYHSSVNWLQHYLPDDRYKIAGGVWKVVSTQYDTHYYRPDSQFMLRQPADIVIGFASEEEAIKAGYRPAAGFPTRPRPAVRTREIARDNPPSGAIGVGSTTAVPSSVGSSRVVGSASSAFSRSFSGSRPSGGGMESAVVHTGPRGGKFHLSASGKKVYEPRGSTRTYAKRRR